MISSSSSRVLCKKRLQADAKIKTNQVSCNESQVTPEKLSILEVLFPDCYILSLTVTRGAAYSDIVLNSIIGYLVLERFRRVAEAVLRMKSRKETINPREGRSVRIVLN